MAFNDEMCTRLWNMVKAAALSDTSSAFDGVDEIEKEKYKNALKAYIESTHQKRTTDEIVGVLEEITDPLKSAKSSLSAATSPIKLDLKIDASADDLRETRKMPTDLGISSDLSDVSDYAKNVDNILDEFDVLSAVGTVTDIAGWGFLQEAEVNNLKSLSAKFTRLYNSEADIEMLNGISFK